MSDLRTATQDSLTAGGQPSPTGSSPVWVPNVVSAFYIASSSTKLCLAHWMSFPHVDGTHLTYKGTPPAGAPIVIDAGQVVQIPTPSDSECYGREDRCMHNEPFVIEGDQPFAVASFMVGSWVQGSDIGSHGDPSFSLPIPVEQFRQQYSFVIPQGYPESFADVAAVPQSAWTATLYRRLPRAFTESEWAFVRIALSDGAHAIYGYARHWSSARRPRYRKFVPLSRWHKLESHF